MRAKSLKPLLSCLQTTIGTALTAAAFGCFVIPQGFAAGGITGLARILSNVLPVSLSVLVCLLNIPVFLIGWSCIGLGFVVKTITVSLLFPVFLEVFSRIPIPSLGMGSDVLMAGLLLGSGCVLVLRSNASSGGFDTLAVALNRKCGVPIAPVVRICDCAGILLQALGQPLKTTTAGILVILVSTAVIEHFMSKSTRKFLPWSHRGEPKAA